MEEDHPLIEEEDLSEEMAQMQKDGLLYLHIDFDTGERYWTLTSKGIADAKEEGFDVIVPEVN